MINTVKLSNGVCIPCIGFGTWKTPAGQAAASVKAALEAGYRHIDTATAYGNEADVGDAIASSDIKRQDIFLTTKLWNPDQGYETTIGACERSLKLLKTDYLDLYLIHWPHDKKYFNNWEEKNLETWHAMEMLYQRGKVRAIGLSNFRPHHIDNILKNASVAPMVDQVESHPGMPQKELHDFCKEYGIVMEGWSPLGSGRAFTSEKMQEIARKYHKSVSQICLRWNFQHEVIPLPKSVHPERIAENMQIFDFQLTDEDMRQLDQLDIGWSGLDPDNLIY